jgi:hypothetical protein
MCLGRGEGLAEGTLRMGRQVVEHDADLPGLGKLKIDEIAHAFGEVAGVRLPVTLSLRQNHRLARHQPIIIAVTRH